MVNSSKILLLAIGAPFCVLWCIEMYDISVIDKFGDEQKNIGLAGNFIY